MKLTAIIAAAILAYTVSSAPTRQPNTHDITSTTDRYKYKYPYQTPSRRQPTYDPRRPVNRPRPHRPVSMKAIPRSQADGDLGPIPVSVAPNGHIVPAPDFQPSSLTGGALEDPSRNIEVAESNYQETAAQDKLDTRAAMWKPDEINNYHDGVKIDIKNSIVELKDKLDYMNARGLLTIDRANQHINELAKVIATRLRVNFMAEDPKLSNMLAALREHIFSAIDNRQKDAPRAPLPEAQQAEQDSEFANLHAHYIIQGLQEKLVLLARTKKLDKRQGYLSIAQARQIIQTIPALSKNDLDKSENQLKLIEKAMQAMIKNKLSDIPATAVSLIPILESPLKSDFKLPGEDDPSVEPSVEGFASKIGGSKASERSTSATSNIEARAAAHHTQPTPLDHFLEVMRWDTLHKRDDNTTVVSITPTPAPTISHDDSFWVDFGAPECLNFIMDEDLDLAKIAQFENCEDNLEPEIEEPSDAGEFEEVKKADKGTVEARGAEKHSCEMEMDESEWGRGRVG